MNWVVCWPLQTAHGNVDGRVTAARRGRGMLWSQAGRGEEPKRSHRQRKKKQGAWVLGRIRRVIAMTQYLGAEKRAPRGMAVRARAKGSGCRTKRSFFDGMRRLTIVIIMCCDGLFLF